MQGYPSLAMALVSAVGALISGMSYAVSCSNNHLVATKVPIHVTDVSMSLPLGLC
ncbi:hypothetical protein PF005_g5836 [Phytophthora fragariae]|uniref:Uncharacterized protein n=1 Tax=Phytophthora fragariae TaxID=53985 RepID=A0A6A3FEN5_9STRA|nr:hypothetical protein PF003_g5813 [Phytophthora fragariae]KAE8944275.1 hypothetical protein PF009_g6044 [Phytophthora fragariae]KAE9008907.1 hypothetical protein PF011_g10512 [Phytophthora fragariae]KAE9119645.1 hypothetical protein PF007_g8466 [Phytophthora fragariae]KAE9121320.1 hypothetical protein PF010_g7153 [Phytophthora fragariae]